VVDPVKVFLNICLITMQNLVRISYRPVHIMYAHVESTNNFVTLAARLLMIRSVVNQ